MIDFESFFASLQNSPLAPYHGALLAALKARFYDRPHGDMPLWLDALGRMPRSVPSDYCLDKAVVRIGRASDLCAKEQQALRAALLDLAPWRKGPFSLFGVDIDAEWRSDWKWQRLAPHLADLGGRRVLDVGCGNGYYLWRMRGQGASYVLGVDPAPRYLLQFLATRRFLSSEPVHLLPLRGEDLPAQMECFDTVFSMGVLSHRRQPQEHLSELFGALRPGGELVLETLVIDDGSTALLRPPQRYAMMRNVWQLPSPARLRDWLGTAGFVGVRVVDLTHTSTAEQRPTEWMTFRSLQDFLDPADTTRTAEGHPAPCRAIALARRPTAG